MHRFRFAERPVVPKKYANTVCAKEKRSEGGFCGFMHIELDVSELEKLLKSISLLSPNLAISF